MNTKTAKILGKKLRKYTKKLRKQTGAALAIVSLILLVLTILIVSSHYTTIVQTTSSASYRDTSQAFYIAEAGVQRTIDWFTHRYADSTLRLQPSPASPPDWPAMSPSIPTGTLGQGDTLYPNRNSGGNLVVLTTNATGSTFPTVTKSSGTTVNMVSDFQAYLASTNNVTSTATGNLQGTYQVTATLLSTKLVAGFTGPSQRVERWRISSIGTWGTTSATLARAENTAVIETLTTPLFSHAICANSFDFNGSPDIDSYSSASGAFKSPTSNQNGTTSIGSFATSTGPFSRGNVDLMGLTPTDGQFDVPTTYQPGLGCGSSVNCGQNFCPTLPAIPTFTLAPFTAGNATSNKGAGANPYTAISTPAACASGTCPTATTPLSSCTACFRDISGGTIQVPSGASGDYSFWAQTITGNVTINNKNSRSTPGALNIFVESMSNNNADITVTSDKDNPVNIYITGDFDFKGNARFNSPSGSEGLNTEGLKVFATTTGAFTLGSSGNTNITGIVYAPNASSVVNGTGDFYGVIITNTFRKNGTSGGVHFDRQLANDYLTVFGFVPQTQVRRIY